MKPQVPDRFEEERRVRGALERYESAYDNLDAAAVRALYPGAPANLADTFAQYQFYRLELVVQKVTLAPDLNSATAVCRLSHFFQPRVGRSQQYRPHPGIHVRETREFLGNRPDSLIQNA